MLYKYRLKIGDFRVKMNYALIKVCKITKEQTKSQIQLIWVNESQGVPTKARLVMNFT